MNKEYLKKLNVFQNKLGLKFENIDLLILALTHSSYANENNVKSNERLEFLGDAVLQLTSSDFLYENFLEYNEGMLSKKRAKNVCEAALAKIAKRIDLGSVMLLGKGEIKSNGKDKVSTLADAFEALLGAIYLDKGLEETYKILDRYFFTTLFEDELDVVQDYKSKLQEYVQADLKKQIEYKLLKEEGPAHDKQFTIGVYMETIKMGVATAKSKKEAERLAAKDALNKLVVSEENDRDTT